jgi:uncharacterized GH25 family protein
MTRKTTIALACWLVLGLTQAKAHFIWIDLKPVQDGEPQAQLYFAELPEPGEARLIGKIAHAKVWIRNVEGVKNLKIEPTANENMATLFVACPKQSAASIEAKCDYGVYQRGPAGVLLQYYAKHLAGDWSKQVGKLARSELLTLDIEPSHAGRQLGLQVLYKGKPAPNSEVVVIDPAGESHQLTTDSEGRVVTEAPRAYASKLACFSTCSK